MNSRLRRLFLGGLIDAVSGKPARAIAEYREAGLQRDEAVELRAVVEEMVRARAEGAPQQRQHTPRQSLPRGPPCKAKIWVNIKYPSLKSNNLACSDGKGTTLLDNAAPGRPTSGARD